MKKRHLTFLPTFFLCVFFLLPANKVEAVEYGRYQYQYQRTEPLLQGGGGFSYMPVVAAVTMSVISPSFMSVTSSPSQPVYNQTASVVNGISSPAVSNVIPDMPKTGGGGRGLTETFSSNDSNGILFWSGGITLILILGFFFFRKSRKNDGKI